MDKATRVVLFLILGFMSIGVFRLALELGNEKKRKISSLNPKSEHVEAIVNKHLADTDQKIRISNDLAEMKMANPPTVGDRVWPASAARLSKEYASGFSKSGTDSIDLSSDSRESSVLNDLDRNRKEYGKYKSPDFVIQSENSEKDQAEIQVRMAREKYAQQFIENAKAHGYQVKVDENFVVVEVKKLSKPSNFKIPGDFGSSAAE